MCQINPVILFHKLELLIMMVFGLKVRLLDQLHHQIRATQIHVVQTVSVKTAMGFQFVLALRTISVLLLTAE